MKLFTLDAVGAVRKFSLTTSFLLVSTVAQAQYVYTIEIQKPSGKTVTALATKINDSQFVTDAALLSNARQIVVIDDHVTPQAKVLANVHFTDATSRLAVLTANNISGDAITVAAQPQALGGQLLLNTGNANQATLVQRIEPIKGLFTGDVYVHTALYQQGQWGAPLLNNCQQLVGISIYERGIFEKMQLPEVIAYAASFEPAKALLAANAVALTVASAPCLSDVEQAKLAAQQAELDAKAAEAAKKAANEAAQQQLAEQQRLAEQKAKQAADELAAAKQRELEAQQQFAKQQQAAEDALAKAEQQRKASEQQAAKQAEQAQQQQTWLLAGIALLVILAVVMLLVMRSRKNQLQQQATQLDALAQAKKQLSADVAQLQQRVADIILQGTTADGRRLSVKIDGALLAQRQTLVLGRESAQVDCVVAEPDVSRKHLVFKLSGEQVLVGDLGSQNGSWVNEQPLAAGEFTAIQQGTSLRISSVEFTVQFIEQ